jgi:arylsulfatase A-like enzyme
MSKNIVVLITDTFRHDNLGDRADRPVRTPALDAFAAERATEFTRCYMGSFPTIPHRTDFATGVLGWPHYGWQPIERSGPNHVGEMLGEHGYATQLICDNPHLFICGFQHGFDAAFQHRGQEADKPLLHLNDPVLTVVPDAKTRPHPRYKGHTLVNQHRWTNRYQRYEADSFSSKTAGTAVRWLEENCEAESFFLWVDFFDPHEPWDPPEYLVRRYDPDYVGTPMLHPNYGPSSDYTPDELHNLWSHYAAETELVDRHIGKVLQKIEDLQLWDDTIVVVMSDHGMSLGEHDRTGKSNRQETDMRYWPIYPEVGHVIFLVAGGDVPKGQRLDSIVQPMDIVPTLCDLAGVNVSPPKPFDGLSFADAIVNGDMRHREFAVSGCHIQTEGSNPPRQASTPFLVTDRWGYAPVGAQGRPELYDLSVDRLAARDVAADHEAEVHGLHELFLQHLSKHGAPDEVMALWARSSGNETGGGAWAIDYEG